MMIKSYSGPQRLLGLDWRKLKAYGTSMQIVEMQLSHGLLMWFGCNRSFAMQVRKIAKLIEKTKGSPLNTEKRDIVSKITPFRITLQPSSSILVNYLGRE